MATQTETTRTTTLRAALKAIRADLEGRSYLPAGIEYPCDRGTLLVSNRAETDGQGTSYLLGQFVIELLDRYGRPTKTYRA